MRTLDYATSAVDLAAAGTTHVLLLDIDGVVAPDGLNTPPKAFYATTKKAYFANPDYDADNWKLMRNRKVPKGFWLRWSPEMVTDLNMAVSDPKVTVVFLTSWVHGASWVSEGFGIDAGNPMYVLNWAEIDGTKDNFGKVDAASKFLAGAAGLVKVAWLDDYVLGNHSDSLKSDAVAMLSSLGFDAADLFLVGPNGKVGPTRADIAALKTFLEV